MEGQSCHGMQEIKVKDIVESFWFGKLFKKIKDKLNSQSNENKNEEK